MLTFFLFVLGTFGAANSGLCMKEGNIPMGVSLGLMSIGFFIASGSSMIADAIEEKK